jgi:hypothetical protein
MEFAMTSFKIPTSPPSFFSSQHATGQASTKSSTASLSILSDATGASQYDAMSAPPYANSLYSAAYSPSSNAGYGLTMPTYHATLGGFPFYPQVPGLAHAPSWQAFGDPQVDDGSLQHSLLAETPLQGGFGGFSAGATPLSLGPRPVNFFAEGFNASLPTTTEYFAEALTPRIKNEPDEISQHGTSKRRRTEQDPATLERRRAQIRRAQRSHRDRKAKHVKDLEGQVAVLNRDKAQLLDQVKGLQAQNQHLLNLLGLPRPGSSSQDGVKA